MKRQKEFKSVTSFGEVPAAFLRCLLSVLAVGAFAQSKTVSGTS